MVIIAKRGYEILDNSNPLQLIEYAARLCYKSENFQTGKEFIQRLWKGNGKDSHMSPFEHAQFIFEVPEWYFKIFQKLLNRHYIVLSIDTINKKPRYVVSGNFRSFYELSDYNKDISGFIKEVIEYPLYMIYKQYPDLFKTPLEPVEELSFKVLKYEDLTPLEIERHWRVSVKFISNRGISHEAVRNSSSEDFRGSYSQLSTRYCDFSKDKHGKEIKIVVSSTIMEGSQEYKTFMDFYAQCERIYMYLRDNGTKPQVARDALPIGLETEWIQSMNMFQWMHFLNQRSSSDAHPDMVDLVKPLREEFVKRYPMLKWE